MPATSECRGCARYEINKCTVMDIIPKQRNCFVTLDQAIKSEIEIIEYIDAGKYPHDDIQDKRQRTMAENKLKKLKEKQKRLMA